MIAAAGPVLGQESDGEETASFRLTDAEVERARAIAERSIQAEGLRATGPLLLVESELELAKMGDREQARLAHVVHYRYEGDLTIETVIDLASGEVVDRITTPRLPTRLAPEEVQRVSELVLAEPRIRGAVEEKAERVEVEAMVFSPPPETPLYGTRAVLAHLKRGEEYLNLPFVIYVDLTNGRVILEEKQPETEHHEERSEERRDP